MTHRHARAATGARTATLVVTALLGLALLSGCGLTGSDSAGSPQPAAGQAAGARPQGIPVVTAAAASERLRTVATAPGEVRPLRTVQVAPKVGGRVAAVHVDLGDEVAAGDVLLQLEDEEARARVDQARASLAQARAQLDTARREAERAEQLLHAGALTRQQYDNAQSQATQAATAVAAAEAALELARLNLEAMVVTAPVAGTIAARSAEPGNFASPGAPLFQLVDISQVRVAADVAEQDINRVAPGQSVSVWVPALARSFTGQVQAVAPAANDRSGKFPVHLVLPNPEGQLKGGMYAELELATAEQEGITVPVDAVVERSGIALVFVVEDGVARERRVQILLRSNGRALVEGLAAGAPVVVSGQQVLRDGTPVAVQQGAQGPQGGQG